MFLTVRGNALTLTGNIVLSLKVLYPCILLLAANAHPTSSPVYPFWQHCTHPTKNLLYSYWQNGTHPKCALVYCNWQHIVLSQQVPLCMLTGNIVLTIHVMFCHHVHNLVQYSLYKSFFEVTSWWYVFKFLSYFILGIFLWLFKRQQKIGRAHNHLWKFWFWRSHSQGHEITWSFFHTVIME